MKKIGSRTGREDSTTIYQVLKKVWGRKVERITSVVPEIQSRPLVTDWLMQSEEEAAAVDADATAAATAAAEAEAAAVTDCLWNETNFFFADAAIFFGKERFLVSRPLPGWRREQQARSQTMTTTTLTTMTTMTTMTLTTTMMTTTELEMINSKMAITTILTTLAFHFSFVAFEIN